MAVETRGTGGGTTGTAGGATESAGEVAHAVPGETDEEVGVTEMRETGAKTLVVTTDRETEETTGETTGAMTETDLVGTTTEDRPRDEPRSRKPEDSVASTRNPDASPNGPLSESGMGPTAGGPDGEIEEGEDMEEDEAQMMAAMGFGGFETTKGKSVVGNQQGAANIKKQRTWRQYMNRKGGFNRPLDKIK
ncbi:U4 small nuclear ribonucleo 27 kDa [Ceratobasidium sp. AG-Ba]|nr:U4 small nuclear ribonucleo 27 kDa [Ceratobasidium sp. AG-Ba]